VHVFVFLIIPRPPRSTLFPYTTLFFFNDTATTEIYTLSLTFPDSSPICASRSEAHTSELQSRPPLVCRLLLEKKNISRAPAPKTRSATIDTLFWVEGTPS